MQKIKVKLSEPRTPGYEILLEPGLLKQAGTLLKTRFPGHAPFLISSPTVYGIHGKAFEASLKKAGLPLRGKYLLPDGEEHKNLDHFMRALAALALFDQDLRSKTLVVLLGGGVVGDLGGFVAASYKRGIPFVQVPTTLLSMVDSSVGGKLGIDFHTPSGTIKNMVGVFYQPSLVLVDPLLLRTLPAREVRCGFAEAVKTAVLFDPALFKTFEAHWRDLLALKPALMQRLIGRCVSLKAALVRQDEFDRKGKRILLNLGHTFGHALESASGFRLKHGEAVAFGLCCACDLSRRMGLAPGKRDRNLRRVETLLGRLSLPLRISGISVARVLKAMGQDKKFDSRLRFVLPLDIGRCKTVEVRNLDRVQEVLAARLS